jgi:uncharacterized protein (TIGR03000 family)
MFRNAVTVAGTLLVAGVLALWSPATATAAPRGGHWGGHGSFWGGHWGGHHGYGGLYGYGGYRGLYYGPGWGNYRGYAYTPYYYGSWYNPGLYYPNAYYSYPYSTTWAYDYPYYQYSLYGYSPSYSDVTSEPAYYTDQYSMYEPDTGTTYQVPGSMPGDSGVNISVTVPPDAKLWFEGRPTQSTGPEREFRSPPLMPGQNYSYDVRAQWTEKGRQVTQEKKVFVRAGEDIHLTFPSPPDRTGGGK